MAETGERNDPFFAFRFEVKLDDLTLAGFSECNGLQSEIEFHDYQEGGRNDYVHKFPTRVKQNNLVLKRGIVDRELWDWYYEFIKGDVSPKNGSIVVRDEQGSNVVMEWNFTDALPAKWQGSDLNASQNNIAVETLELNYLLLERIK